MTDEAAKTAHFLELITHYGEGSAQYFVDGVQPPEGSLVAFQVVSVGDDKLVLNLATIALPAEKPAFSTSIPLLAAAAPAASVDSASDQRTVNNTMRHAYRVLSDEEKAAMQEVKDIGLALHDRIAAIGNSRELALAKTKAEEAVMWAVKHITA